MRLNRLPAVAVFAAALLAPAAFAQQKPSFLILGTFHFRGSDSDLMGNSLPDVQSEKRQKEIEAVVETAEVVAGWYRRNLLIYSNLIRLIGSPDERVLLVIGAGHAKLLRDYIRQSPNLRLEEAVDFLP